MSGPTTETRLVLAFNRFLGGDGVAYRIREARYAEQIVDFLVDSKRFGYQGWEAKSIQLSKGARALYFSQHFHQSRPEDQGCQVNRISEFLRRSGRKGFLAVELRWGVGHSNSTHVIPWSVVESRFKAGVTGFKVPEIQAYPPIPQNGRNYELTKAALLGIGFEYEVP
ncbi:MAG: hypothetical protein QXQ87_09215 [Halobacteria archaeon]